MNASLKLTPHEAQLLCSIMLSVRNSCRLELQGLIPNTPLPDRLRATYLAECAALTEKMLYGYQQAQTSAPPIDPKLTA